MLFGMLIEGGSSDSQNDLKEWLSKDGESFLRDIGIKKGHTVLDFGCGVGHYTVPAAKVVGETGRVYALDKDGQALDELRKTAKSESLRNIEAIKTSGQLEIPVGQESVDVTLLYDVLHYIGERKRMIGEVCRVMKSGGLLSVYPKHHCSDSPSGELAHLNLEDIRREVEEAGFSLETKVFKKLMHDDHYDEGYILNFVRESLSGKV